MIDVMTSSDGPGSIVWDQGTAQTNGGAGLAMLRTTLVLDTPVLDVNTEIGDHRPGVGRQLLEGVDGRPDAAQDDAAIVRHTERIEVPLPAHHQGGTGDGFA